MSPNDCTYNDVTNEYVSFVANNYGNKALSFDGYGDRYKSIEVSTPKWKNVALYPSLQSTIKWQNVSPYILFELQSRDIWDINAYKTEAYSQLNSDNYKDLPGSRLKETEEIIVSKLNDLVAAKVISNKEKRAMTQTNNRKAEFYMLPKIHKNRLKPPAETDTQQNGYQPGRIKNYKLVYKNNIFKFDNRFFIQTKGTTMVPCMALAYANIFMHSMEEQIIALVPEITLWRRYIDDIFCILEETETVTAETLLTTANGLHNTIQFTMEADKEGIAYLDMILTIENNSIIVRPYTKPIQTKNCIYRWTHVIQTTKKTALLIARLLDEK